MEVFASYKILVTSCFLCFVACEIKSEKSFHNSYQIQDDCQFQLCGLKYNSEFGLDSTPTAGSCSGDCDLLSVNLVKGKFEKEYLWSNCARICQNKFPFVEFSDYKPRFACMETCYSAYNKIAPHHDLARYCLQASCPGIAVAEMSQLDCFSQCTSHVVTSVPPKSWSFWAHFLAGPCQSTPSRLNPSPNHKLTCADSHLWTSLQTSLSLSPEISITCLQTICNNNIKCAEQCVHHIRQLQDLHRNIWTECSKSELCSSVTSSFSQRLKCSDKCLEEHREELLRWEEEEEKYRQEKTQLNARFLSSNAGVVKYTTVSLALVAVFMIHF